MKKALVTLLAGSVLAGCGSKPSIGGSLPRDVSRVIHRLPPIDISDRRDYRGVIAFGETVPYDQVLLACFIDEKPYISSGRVFGREDTLMLSNIRASGGETYKDVGVDGKLEEARVGLGSFESVEVPVDGSVASMYRASLELFLKNREKVQSTR